VHAHAPTTHLYEEGAVQAVPLCAVAAAEHHAVQQQVVGKVWVWRKHHLLCGATRVSRA
jgi:hypothetical protein